MKTISLSLLLCLCGCSTTNITKLAKEVKDDPAIVVVKVSSVYGTASLVRIGSRTNIVSIAPDGTITVGK